MLDRRRFLGALAAPAVAADEAYWREAQQAFTVDRTLVNLNNGGVSPSPAVVQAAMKRHLDYSNQVPPYTMWQVLEPQREPVRERLARFFGCDAEEIALTRNASEGLQICQCGFDLEPGDEVLTTTQDYPRMIDTFRQREAREGIVLRQVAIPVVVDGAHGFAHFPFTAGELDCDYYATSLHKWLFAPHGTGLLYVRRERIAELWPLTAPPERLWGDIRKFEEIGTHPAANTLAIAEALTFHLGLGPERKAARLRHLTRRWAERLLEHDRVRLHTSLDPRFSCGLATVQVEGVGSVDLARHLWEEHRILVTAIEHPEVEGIRVTPSVYTTLEEIDRFVEAVEGLLAT